MTNPISDIATESGEHRLFTLKNAGGMTVTISEKGALLHSWHAPDRYGRMADILLAEAGMAPQAVWQGRHEEDGVSFLQMSSGGGATRLARYRLDDDGGLAIEQEVMALAPMPLEMTAAPHFDLSGGTGDVGDHMLQIDADYYVELSAAGAPAGVAAVGGTPFDFREPAPIGARLRWPDPQIRLNGGFGHSFFVRSHFSGGQGSLREVARVFDPGSGRRLQIYTTEAALQFGTSEARWRQGGFCLDARARPELSSAAWPHVMLMPGQVYRQATVYRLSLQV